MGSSSTNTPTERRDTGAGVILSRSESGHGPFGESHLRKVRASRPYMTGACRSGHRGVPRSIGLVVEHIEAALAEPGHRSTDGDHQRVARSDKQLRRLRLVTGLRSWGSCVVYVEQNRRIERVGSAGTE